MIENIHLELLKIKSIILIKIKVILLKVFHFFSNSFKLFENIK